FILFLFISLVSVAQKTATLSGTLSDDKGEPVQNANITFSEMAAGAVTDQRGYFEIKVPAGKKITITISSMGFQSITFEVKLDADEKRNVSKTLSRSTTELESIEVRDQQMRKGTFNRLDPKEINLIPTANGGVEDLIKTLPGVASRNELSSQYSVRGGSYDENLVFVNDIEIYRPFLVRSGQQEGLSFLNPDLVSSIAFSAGGFEAKFGDKMSSVLDIRYKRPTAFAASAEVSLLGANAHVEGMVAKKTSYLLGIRYKSNSYFLKGLDTKGSYKPRYFDVQGMINHEFGKKWDLSVLGTFSSNIFRLIPETRDTRFGTQMEAYQITMFFDGQEKDRYQNWLGAVTLGYKPQSNLRLKLTSSAYQTFEQETYDISAEYWIGKLETFDPETQGQVTEVLGVGAFMNHARNYLDGTVFNIEHRGTWEPKKQVVLWGIKYQHEYFYNKISEWEMHDSAGYTLPHPPDSIGNPDPPHDPLLLTAVIRAANTVNDNRYTAFIQDTWSPFEGQDFAINAGARIIYTDINHQFLFNPRISFSYRPKWKKEVVFRLASGYYSQPPSFRELTDLQGNIVPDMKAQTAIQFVGGSDIYFKAWGRMFKFVGEAYYKYLQDLIPYDIDNLKIRYYGNNDAHGYATGVDFRINGEFVKGAESWASLSFMSTKENINGVWIPRPTDQRVNFSIFFQDYIPGYPTWRMNLTLFYGTGLPVWQPNSMKTGHTFRIPPYRRVDIGLSKQIISENTTFSAKNPFRSFKSLWISLEVFNLLQLNNTISYLWVTDISNNQYGVPNYLTPRQFNLKLMATF
ncbi:MAG: TonB-dependent receptor, partial [Syntrophothermus sp.]